MDINHQSQTGISVASALRATGMVLSLALPAVGFSIGQDGGFWSSETLMLFGAAPEVAFLGRMVLGR